MSTVNNKIYDVIVECNLLVDLGHFEYLIVVVGNYYRYLIQLVRE